MDRNALIAAMQATAAAPPAPVDVKGWGTVHIRAVMVSEVEEQSADTADKQDKNKIARAACRVICDENGKRLLDPDNEEDVALVAKQPWPKLRKILKMSGSEFGEDDSD